jgi:hypothetical protein
MGHFFIRWTYRGSGQGRDMMGADDRISRYRSMMDAKEASGRPRSLTYIYGMTGAFWPKGRAWSGR